MTFDDPGDPLFSHLDDPTPPMHGGDALTNVVQRGQQIRRRPSRARSSVWFTTARRRATRPSAP
jgi:hypothetical protein